MAAEAVLGEELVKLAKLRAEGTLSDEEFKALKAKFISQLDGSTEAEPEHVAAIAQQNKDVPAVGNESLIVSSYGPALTVYILYLAGLFTGLTVLSGAIIARLLVSSVYILYSVYLAGFFTALTALIGVIIAYVKAGRSDEISRSHFRFQKRTFWIGLLYLVIGLITSYLGIFVLIWWVVWTAIRCTKGLLTLNTGKPIRNPGTWLFG